MGASDRFVVSAVRLARALGVSTVLIGALIVGLGTSLPELLVSAIASLDGKIDVAMANVTGSNVANVTLVMGAAALVAPIMSRTLILRREGVMMFVAVSALAGILWDSQVSRVEGVLLLLGMVIALVLLIRWSSLDNDAVVEVGEDEEAHSVIGELLIGGAALAITVFAAQLLLTGALDIGEEFGLGEAFLGVMLGVGTSLPELATTMAAVRRHESDLVIGNILGSNLFNSLAVAGAAAVAGPGVLVDLARPALVVMVAVVILAGWFAWSHTKVVRSEGSLLLIIFIVFAVLSY
jgi:cation:H+ antiporter